jgi:hypothetical protein
MVNAAVAIPWKEATTLKFSSHTGTVHVVWLSDLCAHSERSIPVSCETAQAALVISWLGFQ